MYISDEDIMQDVVGGTDPADVESDQNVDDSIWSIVSK